MDFKSRHKAMRGAGVAKYYDAREAERNAAKQGLDSNQYWLKFVHDYDTALVFYQLYYPEYPDVLMQACAKSISDTILRSKSDPQFAEECMRQYALKQAQKRETGQDAGAEIREVEERMLSSKLPSKKTETQQE